MSESPEKPVVFLTFANAADKGYLQQLKKESALLRDLFLPLHQAGQIELLREESLDKTELPRLLNQYKGRIALFHYGGHAGGESLSLEDGEGNAAGLAELLRLQDGLKLVFLNGCSTQRQALPYLEAGAPVVLATSRSIPDEEATFFAEHFYHALLNRHTIREAYQSASGALKTRSSAYPGGMEEAVVYRGLALRKEKLKELPWRLYVQEGKEAALDWTLVGDKTTGMKAKDRKQKLWQWIVGLGVVVGILAGIFGIADSVKDWLAGGTVDSFSVTVLVHGKEGKDDRILRGQGEVVLDFGATREEAAINDKGEATFKELPAGYIGRKALISIDHPQPYFPTDRDKKYLLEKGKSIYLEAELQGTDKVQGRVLDFATEAPLDSVRVSYQNIAAYTDAYGWFELNIPPEKQAKFIRLNFYKEGYKMADSDSIAPHTQQDIGILLEKR